MAIVGCARGSPPPTGGVPRAVDARWGMAMEMDVAELLGSCMERWEHERPSEEETAPWTALTSVVKDVDGKGSWC